tara:strand:- start:5437 stop:5592 length:156 start_codon:yes stop_codon:yes gene_type:complete
LVTVDCGDPDLQPQVHTFKSREEAEAWNEDIRHGRASLKEFKPAKKAKAKA